MSKIDELIKELCPNGVEWKKLGEICTIVRGASPRPIQKFLTEDENGIAWIRIGDATPGTKYITSCEEKITKEGAQKSRMVHKGDFILSNSMSFGRPYILGIDGCIHDGWIAMSDYEKNALPEYFYYILLTEKVQKFWTMKANSGGAVSNLNADIVRATPIPVPPLPIQEEIVRILDKFVEQQEQLEKLLELRKKQYEYYREELLTPKWPTVVLGSICEVSDYVANGSFASLRENVEYKQQEDYAALIRTSDFSTNFDKNKMIYIDEHAYNFLQKSKLEGGEIIINNIGAGVGSTFLCPYLDKKMSLAPNSIMVKTPNNKFYYYWFISDHGQSTIKKIISEGSMPKFNKTGFRSLEIPVPIKDIQDRIVKALDSFDSSITELTSALEASRARYAHYRDQLLNFKTA